jgi:prephenate dehydrogenase
MTESPNPGFQQIAIVGLGLIGGSLALDLRRLHLAEHLLGYDQRPHHCEEALHRNLVDSASTNFDEKLRDADLVILATPVSSFPQVLHSIRPQLGSHTLVSDVGSVKSPLLSTIQVYPELIPRFVGGHPIAGGERFGPTSARTHLFEGKRFILTPTDATPLEVTQRLQLLWEALGSKVAVMNAAQHDQIFAAVSHLPHLIAYASIQAIIGSDQEEVLQFSGAGLKDFSRIASSSPEMWTDIFLENREHLLPRLRHLKELLGQLDDHLEHANREKLQQFLQQAKFARDQWIG